MLCPQEHWDPRAAPQAVAMTLLSPSLAGYEETLMRLAAILAKHFADSRIVGTGEAAFLCFWGDNVTGLASGTANGSPDFCCDLSAESVECLCLHIQNEAGHCSYCRVDR